MAGNDELDVAGIAGAIGGLQAEVAGLTRTTSEGFEGVNARLDRQNGRIGTVEHSATRIEATMVTTAACEKKRARAERTRSANWRAYVVPVAVGLSVALGTILLTRIAG